MKRAKYTGQPINLGRFGDIEKGAIIKFHEYEWDCLAADPNFKLLHENHSESDIAKAAKAKKEDGKVFDLTIVPWTSKRLYETINARIPRKQCIDILASMKEAGCIVRPHDDATTRSDLADFIVEASRLSGWHIAASLPPKTAIAQAVRKRARVEA